MKIIREGHWSVRYCVVFTAISILSLGLISAALSSIFGEPAEYIDPAIADAYKVIVVVAATAFGSMAVYLLTRSIREDDLK